MASKILYNIVILAIIFSLSFFCFVGVLVLSFLLCWIGSSDFLLSLSVLAYSRLRRLMRGRVVCI